MQEAWQNLPEDTIRKALNRIPIVLQMIFESGGENIVSRSEEVDKKSDTAATIKK